MGAYISYSPLQHPQLVQRNHWLSLKKMLTSKRPFILAHLLFLQMGLSKYWLVTLKLDIKKGHVSALFSYQFHSGSLLWYRKHYQHPKLSAPHKINCKQKKKCFNFCLPQILKEFTEVKFCDSRITVSTSTVICLDIFWVQSLVIF